MDQQTPENKTSVPAANNPNTVLSKLHLTPKKIKIGIIIAVIVIAILYLNSASFLRSQLTFGSWYEVYRYDDGTVLISDSETKFYPDGGAIADFDEWEILDDKTLVIESIGFWDTDVTYYDYGEWYCFGWKLVIGDDYEFTRFPGSDE